MAKSFAQNLRYLRTFALFLRMKRNEFLRKPGNIFCESRARNKILVLRNLHKTASFTQNVTFLGKLSKIDVLSLELNN